MKKKKEKECTREIQEMQVRNWEGKNRGDQEAPERIWEEKK